MPNFESPPQPEEEKKQASDTEGEPKEEAEKEQEPSQEKAPETEQSPDEIIREFDAETRRMREQRKDLKRRIEQIEEAASQDLPGGVPSQIEEGRKRDIEELQAEQERLAEEIKRRGPSEEEVEIRREVRDINARIRNIEEAASQDLPGGVPSQIEEGRKRDIEELKEKKREKMEELKRKKVERIQQYRAEHEEKERLEEAAEKASTETPEKPKERVEEGSEEREKPPAPWEAREREEEKGLYERYAESRRLSVRTQELAKQVLREEIDERRVEFARNWFEEHREELEREGIPTDISDDRKVAVAIERGALEDLKTDERHREEREEIEMRDALRTDLERKVMPIESQLLLLHVLEQKARRIQGELARLRKEGADEAEIKQKEREVERLFEARHEIAAVVTGRNLNREASREMQEEYGDRYRRISKEDYVRGKFDDEVEKRARRRREKTLQSEWEKLSEEQRQQYGNDSERFAAEMDARRGAVGAEVGADIPEDVYYYLLAKGYRPQDIRRGGLFGRKIEVARGDEKPVRMSEKEFEEFIRKEEAEMRSRRHAIARRNLEARWERAHQRAKEIKRKKIEARIRELSESPEKAEEGVRGAYRRVRERLVREYLEQLEKEKEAPQEKAPKGGEAAPEGSPETPEKEESKKEEAEKEKAEYYEKAKGENPVELFDRLKELIKRLKKEEAEELMQDLEKLTSGKEGSTEKEQKKAERNLRGFLEKHQVLKGIKEILEGTGDVAIGATRGFFKIIWTFLITSLMLFEKATRGLEKGGKKK